MPAKKAKSPPRERYAQHPMFRMEETYRRNLLERTGKTLEKWVAFAKKHGPKDGKALRSWLKEKHGLGSNNAHWIASGDTSDAHAHDPDGYVAALYSGRKAHLRPIHEKLVDLGLSLGADVKACPCQTRVPLYRKYCFAEITPATNGRVDLGLALGETPAAGRLERLGARAGGNRITHRIRIDSVAGVDREVRRWLGHAYARGNEQQDRTPEVAASGMVKLPPDLARALAGSSKAKTTFDACTPRMRGDWVEWIESSAKPETRARRMAQTIERLAAGKKRAY